MCRRHMQEITTNYSLKGTFSPNHLAGNMSIYCPFLQHKTKISQVRED